MSLSIFREVQLQNVRVEWFQKLLRLEEQGDAFRPANKPKLKVCARSCIFFLPSECFDFEEIETIMTRTLTELGEQVRDVDFILDVGAIATIVQPETDKLLKDL